MKKGQMEILGLAIVVVLLLLATVFVVRFVAFKKPTDFRKDFVSSEMASNMINTFIDTTAKDCSNTKMADLLRDCAQETGLICNNGQGSCAYVESTATEIFSKTLHQWKTNYEFLAYVDRNSPLIELGNACLGQKKSKIYPIPLTPGAMFVKLDICG